jgi:hypothetical protein
MTAKLMVMVSLRLVLDICVSPVLDAARVVAERTVASRIF